MTIAAAAEGRGRRFTRETGPPDEPKRVTAELDELIQLVRNAVFLEMRSTVKVELEQRADVKDRLLIILAAVALAAVVGLSVALAFALWGPGR